MSFRRVLPFVCEPVCSACGGREGFGEHGLSRAQSRQPVRENPTEVGGVIERVNHNEIVVIKWLCKTQGVPHCGEGCGDTLHEFNSRCLQDLKS